MNGWWQQQRVVDVGSKRRDATGGFPGGPGGVAIDGSAWAVRMLGAGLVIPEGKVGNKNRSKALLLPLPCYYACTSCAVAAVGGREEKLDGRKRRIGAAGEGLPGEAGCWRC